MKNELIKVLKKYHNLYNSYEERFGVGSLDRCSEFFFDPIRPNVSDVSEAIEKLETALIKNVKLEQMSEQEFATVVF